MNRKLIFVARANSIDFFRMQLPSGMCEARTVIQEQAMRTSVEYTKCMHTMTNKHPGTSVSLPLKCGTPFQFSVAFFLFNLHD